MERDGCECGGSDCPDSTRYGDALKFRSLARRVIYLNEAVSTSSAAQLNHELGLLAEKPEPITLRISSNGGSVEAEMSVVDAIQEAQAKGCKVTGEVYGHGMSAAFSILQACDVRKMGRNAILMVHGITSWSVGDLRDLNAEQKLLARMQMEGAQFLANRSTAAEDSKYVTAEFWLPILEANTAVYLFPDEALEWGMVDEVIMPVTVEEVPDEEA